MQQTPKIGDGIALHMPVVSAPPGLQEVVRTWTPLASASSATIAPYPVTARMMSMLTATAGQPFQYVLSVS